MEGGGITSNIAVSLAQHLFISNGRAEFHAGEVISNRWWFFFFSTSCFARRAVAARWY